VGDLVIGALTALSGEEYRGLSSIQNLELDTTRNEEYSDSGKLPVDQWTDNIEKKKL
jgi:hypothetical protein